MNFYIKTDQVIPSNADLFLKKPVTSLVGVGTAAKRG
jgi:hypothetical protein